MAMRRRFGGGRRFRRIGGRPFQRERPTWQTTNFNESPVTRDGIINEYAIIDPELFGSAAIATASTRVISTRRIIVRGGIAYSMESTTFAQDVVSVFCAIYVIDREDTDQDLVLTSVGSGILEGGAGRVLWTDCITHGSQELATNGIGWRPPEPRFDVDLKVRVNLRNDQLLVFGIEFGSDVTSTIATAGFSAVTRTLCVQHV